MTLQQKVLRGRRAARRRRRHRRLREKRPRRAHSRRLAPHAERGMIILTVRPRIKPMPSIDLRFATRIYRARLSRRARLASERGSEEIMPLDRRRRHGRPSLVPRQFLPGLHLLRLARRSALALSRIQGARSPSSTGTSPPSRRRSISISAARQARARRHLDQYPAAGRRACVPHSPPFGDQRHLLCRDPQGRERHQVRGSAARPDDGRAAAPQDGAPDNRSFVYLGPQERSLLLWESWLRHEVPLNEAAARSAFRVSFNYAWR